jgi:hypothetical protein
LARAARDRRFGLQPHAGFRQVIPRPYISAASSSLEKLKIEKVNEMHFMGLVE